MIGEKQLTIEGQVAKKQSKGVYKKSKIVIEVETIVKKVKGKDFEDSFIEDADYTTSLSEELHNNIFKHFEEYLTDGNDEWTYDILEKLADSDWKPKKVKEFGDLGNISISIHQEDVK